MKNSLIEQAFDLAAAKLHALDVIGTILKSGESALAIIKMVESVLGIVSRDDVTASMIYDEIAQLKAQIENNDKAADERLRRRFPQE